MARAHRLALTRTRTLTITLTLTLTLALTLTLTRTRTRNPNPSPNQVLTLIGVVFARGPLAVCAKMYQGVCIHPSFLPDVLPDEP